MLFDLYVKWDILIKGPYLIKKDIPFASEKEQLSKIVLTYCNSKIVLEILASIILRDHVM